VAPEIISVAISLADEKAGAFRARSTARRKHKPQDEIAGADTATVIATAHEKPAALVADLGGDRLSFYKSRKRILTFGLRS